MLLVAAWDDMRCSPVSKVYSSQEVCNQLFMSYFFQVLGRRECPAYSMPCRFLRVELVSIKFRSVGLARPYAIMVHHMIPTLCNMSKRID